MKPFFISALSLLVLFSCTDSKKQFVGNWIEIMPANPMIVQGVTLNEDGTAASIGMKTLLYTKWELDKESIILWGQSIGNGQTIDFSDTMNVVKITPDSLTLGKYGMYQISYYRVASLADVKPFNVLDSLKTSSDLGDVVNRTYCGLLPSASGEGIQYAVTIYNQQHSGDGVYNMKLTYLGADNGNDKDFDSVGRLYTLKGTKDETYYQLAPFGYGESTNFLYLGDSLVMVGQDFQRAQTELNYTLTLKN